MILRTLLQTGKYSPSTESQPINYMDLPIQNYNNFTRNILESNIKRMKEYDKPEPENLYKKWLEKNCKNNRLLDQSEKRMENTYDINEIKYEPLDDIASTRDCEIDEQIDTQIAFFEAKEKLTQKFGTETTITALNSSSIQKEVTSSAEKNPKNAFSNTSNISLQMVPIESRKDGYEENVGYLGTLGPNSYDPSKHITCTQFDGGFVIDRWNMCDIRNSTYFANRSYSQKQSNKEYNTDNQSYYSNEIAYQFPRNPLSVPLHYTPQSATYLTDKLPKLLPLDDYEDEEKEEEAFEEGCQYTFNQIPDGEGLAEDVLRDFSIATHRKVRGPKNWEFLMRLLADPRANPNLIKWEDQDNYTFRLVQPEVIIDIWNSKSKRPPISYNNFARGLRYHYKRGALTLVREHQMVYGCGPEAINFLKNIMSCQAISHSTSSFFRPWT